jgi:predicted nucleotidyltransferase
MSALEELQKKHKLRWEHLQAAYQDSLKQLHRFRKLLEDEKTASAEVSVVIFGSLARKEWASHSDLDWSLLLDGPVDPRHNARANRLAQLVAEHHLRQPGPTALFGKLTISQNLVHEIGGQDDTNRNLTQRVLMLLESQAVDREEAHRRVIEAILHRYLTNDPHASAPSYIKLKVPRFLFNDVVRYWRTMCVDYASKYQNRSTDGWAIRHLKLRLSRKLIFTAGVLLCFSCDVKLYPDIQRRFRDLFSEENAEQIPVNELVQHLRNRCQLEPLESLAEACLHFAKPPTVKKIFGGYNDFLGILRDDKKRVRLLELEPQQADSDAVFEEARTVGRQFHEGLVSLFFQDQKRLGELTMHYGVF